MENHDYGYLKDELPKPISKEEQYLYSLVMAAANIPHEEPFKSPFWRMEKYWKAFYEVMADRYIYIVPSNDTVGTDAIKNNSVTEDKIDSSISSKLLGDSRVTNSIIASKAVSLDKLTDDIVSRLIPLTGVKTNQIANNSVTSAKIVDGSITAEKLSPDLREKLKV